MVKNDCQSTDQIIPEEIHMNREAVRWYLINSEHEEWMCQNGKEKVNGTQAMRI
jgi:hypothetical protein